MRKSFLEYAWDDAPKNIVFFVAMTQAIIPILNS